VTHAPGGIIVGASLCAPWHCSCWAAHSYGSAGGDKWRLTACRFLCVAAVLHAGMAQQVVAYCDCTPPIATTSRSIPQMRGVCRYVYFCVRVGVWVGVTTSRYAPQMRGVYKCARVGCQDLPIDSFVTAGSAFFCFGARRVAKENAAPSERVLARCPTHVACLSAYVHALQFTQFRAVQFVQ
jgi:hypothetical protein